MPRRFDETQFSKDARAEMHDRGSAVVAFVTDRCVKDPDAISDKDEIFAAFEAYRMETRASWYGSKNHFAAELYSVCQARPVRPRAGNEDRKPMFKGIRLRRPLERLEPRTLL